MGAGNVGSRRGSGGVPQIQFPSSRKGRYKGVRSNRAARQVAGRPKSVLLRWNYDSTVMTPVILGWTLQK